MHLKENSYVGGETWEECTRTNEIKTYGEVNVTQWLRDDWDGAVRKKILKGKDNIRDDW